MGDLPNLSPGDVELLIPEVSNVTLVGRGGQKLVFRGSVNNAECALKFAKIPATDDGEDFTTADIALRARREVETMQQCNSPYMVKQGPLEIRFLSHGDQQLVFFSEELIDGEDLKDILKASPRLDSATVAKAARQIGEAVKTLWAHGKVHRDIKPANIMQRRSTGDFVLLDAGLAFDIEGESISFTPVGTPIFFSPEQFDFANRRNLDFRSDLFSLGTTLYLMATGTHPFYTPGATLESICAMIKDETPTTPHDRDAGISKQLSDTIMRMLGKFPHLRYRTCDQFLKALQGL